MSANNYIISIDGNYDSDANVEFYFFMMSDFYKKAGYELSRYYVNSRSTDEEIATILNNINSLFKSKSNQMVFIVGSLAEPIIEDLIATQQIHRTFSNYEEISRIYKQLSQLNKTINILLIDNKQNKELREGFEKIDSMTISLGFDFKKINVTDKVLLDVYREILYIIEKEGLKAPKIES